MLHVFDPTPLLSVRIPIPVTGNMVVIAVVGIVVTLLLSKLPKLLRWLSSVMALATVVGVIVVGIDDYRGGDLFDRATNSRCLDWNGYADSFDHQRSQYNSVLDRVGADDFSPDAAAVVLKDVERLSGALSALTPPEAATSLQSTWQSVLDETEQELRGYAAGDDFDPTILNQLLDQSAQFRRSVNGRCA